MDGVSVLELKAVAEHSVRQLPAAAAAFAAFAAGLESCT